MDISKKNIKLILIMFSICIVCCSLTLFISYKLFSLKNDDNKEIKLGDNNDYSINSSDVNYDNSNGLRSSNVQCAIEELYEHSTDYSELATRVSALETNSTSVDTIYPVGSIYISTSNTNPATIFGGTWEAFGQGRTLVGVGTNGDYTFTENSTGTTVDATTNPLGEYKHTLSVNEMPAHSHYTYLAIGGTTRSSINAGAIWAGAGLDEGSHTTYAGGSQSHNNIQPYITVYMWKRTA